MWFFSNDKKLTLKDPPSYNSLIDNMTANVSYLTPIVSTRMGAACPCVLLLHLPGDIKTLR